MVEKKTTLTKIQRETLQLLASGEMMVVDSANMARIGDKPVAPKTRYFLTDNRLVTKKEKTKSVTTKGNGFVITDKGMELLRAT